MSEEIEIIQSLPSPWRWSLKAAAVLSLLLSAVLVIGVALSMLPFGLLLAAAYAGYCWSFLKKLDSKSGYTRAIGTGLLTILLILAGAALATDGFDSDNLKPLVLAGLLILIPAALVVVAVKSYYAVGREPGDGWALVGGLAASLIYGAILLISAAVVLPGLLYSRLASNQASAVGSIRTVNVCAAAYDSQYPDRGYPADLAAMGPAAEKCIEPQLASGKKRGYKFAYSPGPRDAKGRIGTYSFTARPIKFGTTGIVNYFTDSTQLIRSTREDRPATAEDSPLTP